MKIATLAPAALVSAALLAPLAARAEVIEIANPGFEMPSTAEETVPGWTAQQHAGEPSYEFVVDAKTFGKGKQSFRLTRTKPEEYAVLEQRLTASKYAGQDVEFTALVKSKEVGPKGFTLCLNFISGDGGILQQALSTPVTGTVAKWTPVKVNAKVPPRTFFIEVGFVLFDGGTAWADEASLKTVTGKPDADPKKAAADARKAEEAKKPDPAKKSPKSAGGA